MPKCDFNKVAFPKSTSGWLLLDLTIQNTITSILDKWIDILAPEFKNLGAQIKNDEIFLSNFVFISVWLVHRSYVSVLCICLETRT